MKVIVLYNRLFHYRIPVWNILAEKCDLTVAYSQGNADLPSGMEVKFKIMHLPIRTYFGRIVCQKDNISKLVKQFDAAIIYGDISWVKYITVPWFHKTPVVFHTIGVSASYNKKYDSNKRWDFLRCKLYNRAGALAFYTDYPIEKYVRMGIKREKMFVANNTVEVHPLSEKSEKNTILMVGTLYRQKGVQVLLDAYERLEGKYNLPELNIIGNGPDFDFIKGWIQSHNMEELIHLRGAIYDIDKKATYFSQALACVSPCQAGLTVLESMGYGVPFITTKDAISGGEIFNIHNYIDGVILDQTDDFDQVIIDIVENKCKYIEMGEKAQEFYNNYRKPEHMAQGLWSALTYSLENQGQ